MFLPPSVASRYTNLLIIVSNQALMLLPFQGRLGPIYQVSPAVEYCNGLLLQKAPSLLLWRQCSARCMRFYRKTDIHYLKCKLDGRFLDCVLSSMKYSRCFDSSVIKRISKIVFILNKPSSLVWFALSSILVLCLWKWCIEIVFEKVCMLFRWKEYM